MYPTLVKSFWGPTHILKNLSVQFFEFTWGDTIASEKLSTGGGGQLEMREKDKSVSKRSDLIFEKLRDCIADSIFERINIWIKFTSNFKF